MKVKFEKIALLVVSVALILGLTASLSSCSYAFGLVEEFLGDRLNGGDGTETDDGNENGDKDDQQSDGGSENKPGSSVGSGTSDEDKSDQGEDETLEFYPGQGSVSPESIDAKNRALLSTVDIVSSFGLSPSAGSGVIYKLDKEKGDAYIVTNYHVIYNERYGMATEVKLYLYGMRYETYAIKAKIISGAEAYDIAVLKVEGSEVLKNSYAMAAELGDSETVRVFDEVYVIGNAEGYGMSVTEGIVSVDSEELEMTGANGSAIELRVMRTSAAINKGNSGGGLYDVEGRLIGVVCAKRTGSDVDNMGYAIPVNLARNIAENIIYFCEGGAKVGVQRPLIGITITAKVVGLVVDEETGELVKAEQIEITELTDTCIAKDLVLVGDLVNTITVDGVTVKVTRLHHIIDHMLTARVGSTVVLNVTRGDETLDVTFTVPESAFTSVR